MVLVHLIGNAHIDPVWLWRWQAGVGEVLATCRSAVERMEEYPEFIFTRGDMWVYEQVEKLDPTLFEKIRHYVKLGRWQIVGGWYVQPDCNLPTAESFRKHMQIGKEYFRKMFDVDVTVGYNIDSFGHNAMIPSFLTEAGYDSYVMMRPMAHEKKLPADLFRWRSPDGKEVLVWRVPGGYAKSEADLTEHIKVAINSAIPGIDHVMCFYGVGDHGGGPTKRQIEWILANKDSIPGARLIFSHPRAFFDAVKPFMDKIPVVEDELQYHAIGCYSVVHDIKHYIRRAEHGLSCAEKIIEKFVNEAPVDSKKQINEAWKKVLFNQFHDIYAGTSLPSAYVDARDQLGYARDVADTIITETLFKRMVKLPDHECHRIVVFNPSDHEFDGYLEHDPWSGWWDSEGWLADESGNRVQCQAVSHESITRNKRSLIWRSKVPPLGERVYYLNIGAQPPVESTDLKADGYTIANSFWKVTATDIGSHLLQLIRDSESLLSYEGLEVIVQHDNTDTWSHGVRRFEEHIAGKFRHRLTILEESGPVRASLRIDTKYQESWMSIWARLYNNDPRLELYIWVNWNQRLRVARLSLPFVIPIIDRIDGIPGGYIGRSQDGQEYPLVDWTMLNLSDGSRIGIVCPNCFSIEGFDNYIEFSLLRAPAYAWHDPTKLKDEDFYRYTDQGEHTFKFIFWCDASPELLKRLALSEHRRPLCYDWTKGVKLERRY